MCGGAESNHHPAAEPMPTRNYWRAGTSLTGAHSVTGAGAALRNWDDGEAGIRHRPSRMRSLTAPFRIQIVSFSYGVWILRRLCGGALACGVQECVPSDLFQQHRAVSMTPLTTWIVTTFRRSQGFFAKCFITLIAMARNAVEDERDRRR